MYNKFKYLAMFRQVSRLKSVWVTSVSSDKFVKQNCITLCNTIETINNGVVSSISRSSGELMWPIMATPQMTESWRIAGNVTSKG